MKKKLIIWLQLVWLSAAAGFAQPGYQGKKLFVEADLALLQAISNASYNKAPGFTTFNTTKEVSASYVTGRRNAVGLSFQQLRTSSLREYTQDMQVMPDRKIHTHAVGIQYKLFRRRSGNLAPLGRYNQIGGRVMFNNVRDEKQPAAGTSFQTYAISIGTGRNKIFYDRIIFSYGVEFSHVFTGWNKEGFSGATYYYKDDAQTMAQYRLWRHSLLNFKLGLGFLAL